MNHYYPTLTKSANWVMFPFDFKNKVNELDLTNVKKNEIIDMTDFTT